MDLDALCEELDRRNIFGQASILPSQIPGPELVKKRRSISSSSSSASVVGAALVEDEFPADDPAFDLGNTRAFEEMISAVLQSPLPSIPEDTAALVDPVEIVTPINRKPLRGFDTKPTFTIAQWSRFMREPPNLDITKRTPLFFARMQTDLHAVVPGAVRTPLQKRQRRLEVSPPPAPAEARLDADQISIAEAVDFDIDELRAPGDEEWRGEGDGFVTNGRTSIASTVERPSRRDSIASEFLFSGPAAVPERLTDDPNQLKELIISELEMSGKRNDTVIDFSQVCPPCSTTRKATARALSCILTLASRGEIRIKNNRYLNFNSNESFLFSVSVGNGSSSSDDDFNHRHSL